VNAEITSDMRDRPTRLEHETDRTLAQLIGVLPRGCHDTEHLLPPGRSLVREPPRKPRVLHLHVVGAPRGRRRLGSEMKKLLGRSRFEEQPSLHSLNESTKGSKTLRGLDERACGFEAHHHCASGSLTLHTTR
jgi:hypothetical protein